MVKMTHQLLLASSLFLLLASWMEGTASSDELLTTLESTTFNDFIHLTPDIAYDNPPDSPDLDTKPTLLSKLTDNGRPSQQNSVTKQDAESEAQGPIIRNGRSVPDNKMATVSPRSTTCKRSPTTAHAKSSTLSETTKTSKTAVITREPNTSYSKTTCTKGNSFRTTSVSPKTITTDHEETGVSDRTTLHLSKTTSNTPKDLGTSETTTSLSEITSTSHEGMGTSDITTTISLKITHTSHEGMRTSSIGDSDKTTVASNRTSAFDKTTGRTTAVLDKVTESLGTSYKSISASDKIIGTMGPTTSMGSSDKTITFGGTSEKMTIPLEKTTGIYKTATSPHQTLEASDKTTQISDKTTKASGVTRASEKTTGPLGNTTHKRASISCKTSTIPYPTLQVTSEKTFDPFTTLKDNQTLNSTKSANHNRPDQKTDSPKGSQNGTTQGMLEGNSFPAWAIVIVILVAVILLLLFTGILIMAVYLIRTCHHRTTTNQKENDAEDDVGPNSYPVYLMEQQALGRSPYSLP